MTGNLPGPRLAFGAVGTGDGGAGDAALALSIHSSPMHWMYHSAMAMGRFTLHAADTAGEVLREQAARALAGVVNAAGIFYRVLSSANRSRAVRGELSVARVVLHTGKRLGDAFRAVAEIAASGGLADALVFTGRGTVAVSARLWARHKRALNYLAPAAGLAVLGVTVYMWSQMTFGVAVTYNGRQIGVVKSEQAFRSAVSNVENLVSSGSGSSFSLSSAPVYQMRLVRSSQLLSQDALTDNLVSASGGEVKSAFGLYVDNKLVGANIDSKAVQQMLDGVLSPYKSDSANRNVDFAQNIRIQSGIFPVSAIKDIDMLKAQLVGGSSGAQSYVVKKGDSMPMIANMFHVSLDSLYAMNTSVDAGSLAQGQSVKVSDSQPVLTVRLTRNEITTQDIPYSVAQMASSSLPKNTVQVAVPGQNGTLQTVSAVTYEGNKVVNSQVVSVTMLKAPVTEQQVVGTKESSRSSKRGFSSSSYGSAASGGYYVSGGGSGSASGGGVVALAEQYLGSRYVSGGSSPSGFDCSGFTSYVYGKMGVSLDHSAAGQYSSGNKVGSSNLQSGDLVFFRTGGGGISHVGIYIGNGQFINAQNHRVGVTIASLSGYWANTYAGAVRP